MNTPQEILERVLAGHSLAESEAQRAMERILRGEADPAWIAGLLVALRMKGETADEITGFARAMRASATPLRCSAAPLLDTCGTGGDGAGTFNISTACAFVAAGAGVHVAKHGNRSVSSRCGSADVLETLGASLALAPDAVAACVDEVGFGFMFAPSFHGAMRHAVAPRRALGLRTVFNILGPLTNPAGARHQLLGVFDPRLLDRLAEVLPRLGNGRSLLVHGDDGLDELTVTASSWMLVVDAGVTRVRVDPVALGLPLHPAQALQGGDAQRNAQIVRGVLAGEGGAPRDIVLLNAAAALWAAGRSTTLQDGLQQAALAIDSGQARAVLDRFVEFTRRHAGAA
jgi:anthranilate phosphoribosyltransferase